MKFDVTKVLTIGGTVLTLVGSLVSSIASDRKTKETIAQLVKDEIGKQ